MNNTPYIFLIFLVVFQWSCGDPASTTKPTTKETIATSNETVPPKTAQQTTETYYVTANSGLNYRTAPKGEILGKFPLNTELTIKERTGRFEEITDDDQVKKGEWVGVEIDNKTVYVFDAFLAPEKVIEPSPEELYFNQTTNMFSDLPIYEIRSLERNDNMSYSFISCSDIVGLSNHPDSLAISDKYLGIKEVPKVHTLDKKYRTRFLAALQVKESYNMFIYNYVLDTVFIHPVSQLPVIARINPYGTPEKIEQYDYMIGFGFKEGMSTKDWYKYHYDAHVYIGKENPFSPGNSVPLIWDQIDGSLFPPIDVDSPNGKILKHYKKQKAYKFVNNELTYFLQRYDMAYYLVVVSSDNQPIFKKVFIDSEGVSLTAMSFANKKSKETPEQWTGKIFKNQPPVIFGFEYTSFGCPSIDFLEKEARSIRIACDNRH